MLLAMKESLSLFRSGLLQEFLALLRAVEEDLDQDRRRSALVKLCGMGGPFAVVPLLPIQLSRSTSSGIALAPRPR
jgi:hypothetical protein